MISSQQSSSIAYIGLGSNIADRELNLNQAIRNLKLHPEIKVLRSSSIYETEPVGFVDQAAFLNRVIQVETQLTAMQLFTYMLEVEQRLGRVRDKRWGPRTLDLDLLLFGQLSLNLPELIIPHPRMVERAFVLIPLAEIMDKTTVIAGISLAEHLQFLNGKEGVKPWS